MGKASSSLDSQAAMAGFEPCKGLVDARCAVWGTGGVIHQVRMAIGPISTASPSAEAWAPQSAEQAGDACDGVDCAGANPAGEDCAGQDCAGVVSLTAVVPEALLASMRSFIERHPNWDQYRLVQAALAGFLVQNGLENRAVTRYYLANLFPSQSSFQDSNNCR